ncbi:NUMOD4 motif-containing HNH endonuclease [Gordonia sp. HY285]|uniref:NUMOD4 domain-containing protein n=1 Tax=Gordonia liuliyuniae TaxID=2911517 RepID=UPI001F3760AB|nr:NUMOD4 domain-containing protein [Gordonia liuliyuniae]MCF8610008.1 NUMOD4 motif-containing HNH endonuclease [Gordonia liuliyuniae]
MAEEWRPVVGWEGYYEVSDQGHVRSVERTVEFSDGTTRTYKSRTRSDGPHGTQGHRGVGLWRDGAITMRTVHSLVLEAFVRPRPDGMHACHADGDPANNTVGNLRWDTPSANQFDKVRHGNHHHARKTHCKQGHPYDEANTIVRPGRGRGCRACKNESSRAGNARRRKMERESV